jgi:alpha-beta hydrolase superfamily lysophospholipase
VGKRGRRILLVTLVTGLAGVNLVAYTQARAFTRFSPSGVRTARPESLSLAEKVRVLALGAQMPRPVNARTPATYALPDERHVFPGARGIPLEAWVIPQAGARGTVVLFHGYAASKDSQLREAIAFRDLGFRTMLVDFHGSGGSGGSETSVGFHEAEDVAAAFRYARGLPGGGPIILYGASMGAAAVLKGVGDRGLDPDGLILECPFDSLLATTRHRFTTMGLPEFPMAELLVFWGGVQQGFDGLSYRPAASAARVTRPTLLMSGAADRYVTPDETRAIHAALRGPKRLVFFDGLGHDAGLRLRPREWKAAVVAFLDDVAGPS